MEFGGTIVLNIVIVSIPQDHNQPLLVLRLWLAAEAVAKFVLQACSHAAMTGPGRGRRHRRDRLPDVIVAGRAILIHAGGVVLASAAVGAGESLAEGDGVRRAVGDRSGCRRRPNTRRPPCSPGLSVVPRCGPGQVAGVVPLPMTLST